MSASRTARRCRGKMANEEDAPRGQNPKKPPSAAEAEVNAAVARALEARRRRDPAELLSERLSGTYLFSYTFEEPDFTACDAIALGLLAGKTTDGHESWLKEYYLSAFRSVVCALHLDDSEETLALLTPGPTPWGRGEHPPSASRSCGFWPPRRDQARCAEVSKCPPPIPRGRSLARIPSGSRPRCQALSAESAGCGRMVGIDMRASDAGHPADRRGDLRTHLLGHVTQMFLCSTAAGLWLPGP